MKKHRIPKKLRSIFALGVAAFLLGGAYVTNAQTIYDATSFFRASDILDGRHLVGPNYRVSESVRNNGFMNVFSVTVDGESYRVTGNSVMQQRLRELKALQQMEALARTDVYKTAFKRAALSPLHTAKNLITKPVDTVSGIVSGVGTFFGSVGHSLFGGASEQEDGVLKTTLGFDAAKRNFAHRFGIDPYTSFPPVRDRLNEISWSGVAGGLTVGVAFSAIPGVGGQVVSSTKLSDGMNRLIRDNTPAQLKKINLEKLKRIGVNESVAELFLEHPHFSPSEKTRLVDALASISATGIEKFIVRASQAHDETTAVFLRRWAEMMAAYSRRIKPIQRIVRVGKAPFAQRPDGVLVGLFPIDHLAWTSNISKRHGTNMKSLPGVSGVTGGEIWIEGTMTKNAKQALSAQKWLVRENVGKELGL